MQDPRLIYLTDLVHPTWLSEAVNFFLQLPPCEDPSSQDKNGDKVFQEYGKGNDTANIKLPYERILSYEILLDAFQKADPIKYKNLHKGTPFYFLAWLNFDIKNYPKGMYYIDAAISEDFANGRGINGEAAQFYTLERSNNLTKRTVDKISSSLEFQLERYNSLSYKNKRIEKADFINQFVKVVISQKPPTNRSLISALYSFLLEFNELYFLLTTRTSGGGSILPYLTHLFSGGIIFESLLKQLYPSHSRSNAGSIIQKEKFKIDFNTTGTQIKLSSNSLREIVDLSTSAITSIISSIEITCKLRNTTGHNLIWDDIFDKPDNYKILFEHEIDAIFEIIARKYL